MTTSRPMTTARCAVRPSVRSTGAIEFGVVDWFNGDLGFGFIKSDDGGPDIFVHVSEIVPAGRSVEVGQRVSYRVGGTRQHPEARAARVL